jgi:hypothetical protein
MRWLTSSILFVCMFLASSVFASAMIMSGRGLTASATPWDAATFTDFLANLPTALATPAEALPRLRPPVMIGAGRLAISAVRSR